MEFLKRLLKENWLNRETFIKTDMWFIKMKSSLIVLLIGLLLIAGCFGSGSPTTGSVVIDTINPESGTSFTDNGGKMCSKDGKPILRLFATTWCPHCTWVKETYLSVAREYVDKGLVHAYFWEVDIGDDLMTEEKELAVPESELAVFKQFNSRGSIPTFVFGCRYFRVGNAFEVQNDKEAEAREFRIVIDKLIEDTKN